MSVHYKFKSALDYDTVTFDGLHISVGDLKAAISQQKRIGKTSDFDLEITNAQTKEVYVDDHTLIPKNTSLLVARVPLSQQPKKHWDSSNSASSALHKDVAPNNKGLADLSRMEGSEQDKINAMISQSTFDYDPSNYQKIRGQNQRGIVPPNYTCFKCQNPGHWIKDCPVANSSDPVEIRRSTGIPRSFMVPVEGPKAPGAMMTPTGSFAVPVVDREAYLASENAGGGDTPTNAPAAPETAVPDELICSLCRDLLTDAVMIPCCGNSFCDECIRGALLDSEDHECPDCREKEIAPTTLIPNRFLRNSVLSFKNQTGYSRRAPHRAPVNVEMPLLLPQREPRAPLAAEPANGPVKPVAPAPGIASNESQRTFEDSDGSGDDNITVKVPPAHAHVARPPPLHRRHSRYGPPHGLKPPGKDVNPLANIPHRIDEQRASTPTVDERRDPQNIYNRGPHPSQFVPGGPPLPRPFHGPPFRRPPLAPPGTRGPAPFNDRIPREPFQPPPPGIKDSPNGHSEDPLEAFNRMIREKEMRAKRREERRRAASGSPRSRDSRSPRSPRPPRGSRSPRPRGSRSPRLVRSSRSPRPVRGSRSPRPVRGSRSPRPVRGSRSPRPVRGSRSPRLMRGSRSPRPVRGSRSPRPVRGSRSPRLRSPRARLRGRSSSRPRYSRSRSPSRGRLRRSPWSPRRRRTRERTLSLTRSPSPRRRHRSPMRYRSPLRSPPRSPPHRSPLRSPHRIGGRSPLPRVLSPHRYAGVYDELLSPPRRNVEPPYGARYGSRNNLPPAYPPLGVKPIPQLMNMPLPEQPPPGYRGRYEGPAFDGGPPGVEPPVPGFEPPPFEKPPFGPTLAIDRERMPPAPFRDPYGSRPPPFEGTGGFRELPLPIPNEIQVHVGEARFMDNFRQGPPPFRDQSSVQFRDSQPFRDSAPQVPFRDNNYRSGVPPFRDGSFRNIPFREGGFRENPSHAFREGPPGFRPPSTDIRDPREAVPPNFHDPNYRESFRDDNGIPRDARPGIYRQSVRSRGGPRRHPNMEHDRQRDRDGRDGHDRDRYIESRETERSRDPERTRDPDRKPGREGRSREERNRDYEKEKDQKETPERKSRGSPKRTKEVRDKRRSESRGRSRDREGKREKKEDRSRDKVSPDRLKEHKDKDKKIKDRKKKKREKEKDSEKKKKREKKEKKDKDIKKEEETVTEEETKAQGMKPSNDKLISEELITEKIEIPETIEQLVTTVKTSPKTEPNKENQTTGKQLIQNKVDENQHDDLYGDETAETVDKKIMETYVKTEDVPSPDKLIDSSKEEPFDGIELQANADELDLKLEPEISMAVSKEMLAPLPELSKWEVDDDHPERTKEPGEITSPETEEDGGKVTSDVIKRAENAIFTKAISSLRPIEIKKIASDRVKLYGDEPPKSLNNIQITVPVSEADQKSININEKKPRYSKTPPPRLSVKDRLGGKVDDTRRGREPRVVHSTVELVKSRSKTPKKDQPYRRVTVEKEKARKLDTGGRTEKSERRVLSDSAKHNDKRRRSPHGRKDIKTDKKKQETTLLHDRSYDKKVDAKGSRERKKSTLDEANFEPDYDETVEFEVENKLDSAKKRERSTSPSGNELKRPKIETETIKLDLANVKKKPESESETSTDSGESSSSSSSDGRKKKKKKKRSKKKKKRAASESDSDSDSSQGDHKKKKKKRKHKKKSTKKKSKKSKHK